MKPSPKQKVRKVKAWAVVYVCPWLKTGDCSCAHGVKVGGAFVSRALARIEAKKLSVGCGKVIPAQISYLQ